MASNIDTETHKVGGWGAGIDWRPRVVIPMQHAPSRCVSCQAKLIRQHCCPPCLQAGFEPLTERARNLTEVAMVRGAACLGRQLWAVASNQPGWQGRAGGPADNPNCGVPPCPWTIRFPSFTGCSAGEDADGGHRRDAHP